MRTARTTTATVVLLGGLALATPAIASAQTTPEPAPSAAAQFFAQLPPAPEQCAGWWDPIEDRTEDSVPGWATDAYEAFDDWCEGTSD